MRKMCTTLSALLLTTARSGCIAAAAHRRVEALEAGRIALTTANRLKSNAYNAVMAIDRCRERRQLHA